MPPKRQRNPHLMQPRPLAAALIREERKNDRLRETNSALRAELRVVKQTVKRQQTLVENFNRAA
eukprot:3644963-Pyramimonas_sp.AAC.1